MTREEAIKELRSFIGQLTEGCQEAIKVLIPELKESEDERIRKALITLTKVPRKEIFEAEGITKEQALAWLEKQKINTEGDFGRGYDCGYEACLNSNGAEFFEKQKKQKSAEWSEEDEDMRNLLIKVLEVNHPNGYFKVNPINTLDMEAIHVEELVAWLKSLCPQRKQECSIEKGIQWLGENFYHDDRSSGRGELHIISTEEFSSMEEMFDSFRKTVSQPHWKPSEEQMKALNKASRGHYIELFEYDELVNLYNDLKKL